VNHSEIIFCGCTGFDQQIVVSCLLFIATLSVAQWYIHTSFTDFELAQHSRAALWCYNTMFPLTLLTYVNGNNLDYF